MAIPTKKRKVEHELASSTADPRCANNGSKGILSSLFGCFTRRRYDTSSGHESNTTQLMQQTLSHVESMKQMMERMEDKQSQLEDRVDTLQVALEKAQKSHDYNIMLAKNQKWEYSHDVESFEWDDDLDEDEAFYLVQAAKQLRYMTVQMRAGEFPHNDDFGCKNSIGFTGLGREGEDDYSNEKLSPHWEEFFAALEQFAPAINIVPDNSETFFGFGNIRMNKYILERIEEALIGKQFTHMRFIRNIVPQGECDGLSATAITAIVESNKHIEKLKMQYSRFLPSDNIDRFCAAVHGLGSLVELEINGCLEDPGTGDIMLKTLLLGGNLNVTKLNVSSNYITSDGCLVLVDFIANDKNLEVLDLEGNRLKNEDAVLLANALRSNTTLERISLEDNRITRCGFEAFQPVLCNESSLNAVSDSNHSCHIDVCLGILHDINCGRMKMNRSEKIYDLLFSRHQTMSNAQHFSEVDVKLLPNMIEAVHDYAELKAEYGQEVRPLSITYEIMRKWDKVFNIY